VKGKKTHHTTHWTRGPWSFSFGRSLPWSLDHSVICVSIWTLVACQRLYSGFLRLWKIWKSQGIRNLWKTQVIWNVLGEFFHIRCHFVEMRSEKDDKTSW